MTIEPNNAPQHEPFGYVFQHEETGLVQVVDVQQVEWGFEKNNPRLQKIGPVYLHPPAVLEEPARVGNAVFRKGVAISTLVAAAQRLYEHEARTPPPSTHSRGDLADVIRLGIKDQGYGYTLKGDKLTVSSDEVFAIDITKLADFIRAALATTEGSTE